jgi:hypothetical protein
MARFEEFMENFLSSFLVISALIATPALAGGDGPGSNELPNASNTVALKADVAVSSGQSQVKADNCVIKLKYSSDQDAYLPQDKSFNISPPELFVRDGGLADTYSPEPNCDMPSCDHPITVRSNICSYSAKAIDDPTIDSIFCSYRSLAPEDFATGIHTTPPPCTPASLDALSNLMLYDSTLKMLSSQTPPKKLP